MKIYIQNNILLLFDFFDFLFQVIDLRLHFEGTISPFSIQIKPRSRESIVSIDNSIGINHGHNIEAKVLPQKGSKLTIMKQSLDKPLHDKRTNSFPRMCSCCEEDSIFVIFVSNYQ